ncbi:MAG: CDP-alcohol phosphatidyltransferase family protein [Candidatus Tectomicrobia bacterium]|nr:CDP-alcohol phosphatidyltransferase family protein [Candidatus Tectomicrobia bacterium]
MIKKALILAIGEEYLFEIAGLPLIQRTLYSAQRGGVEEFIILTDQNGEALRTLVDHHELAKKITSISLQKEGLDPSSSIRLREILDEPFILFTRLILFDSRLLSQLSGERKNDDLVLTCGKGDQETGIYLIFPNYLPLIEEMVEEKGPITQEKLLAKGVKVKRVEIGDRFWHPIEGRGSLKEAEKQLLKSLIKETDSPLAKLIDRNVSLAISRWLAKTSITPNQITLLTLFIGLLGSLLLAIPDYLARVVGTGFFLFSSVTDGCDGEIARLKFQESRYGGWLDILCDNITHIAIFSGLALGLYSVELQTMYLWLGGLASLGVILSVGLVSYTTLRKKAAQGPFFTSFTEEGRSSNEGGMRRFLANLDDYLARRDFIYLMFILALIDRLDWFLWAAGIGSPLFFISLIVMKAVEHFSTASRLS